MPRLSALQKSMVWYGCDNFEKKCSCVISSELPFIYKMCAYFSDFPKESGSDLWSHLKVILGEGQTFDGWRSSYHAVS